SGSFKGNSAYTQVRETAYSTPAAHYIRALGGNLHDGMCLCPAHDDKKPSLHVSDGRKRVVFKCFAGCSQEAVITALRKRGLWPPSGNLIHHNVASEQWDEYKRFRKALVIMHTAAQADAGKPVDYLRGRGSNTVPDNGMLLPAKLAHRLRGRIPLFRDFPAMVLPVTDGKHLLGAHVTFLSKDGTAQAKAAHEPKLTYGPIRGGYIQLCELDHENLPEKLI